jgi:hypothetical protein
MQARATKLLTAMLTCRLSAACAGAIASFARGHAPHTRKRTPADRLSIGKAPSDAQHTTTRMEAFTT